MNRLNVYTNRQNTIGDSYTKQQANGDTTPRYESEGQKPNDIILRSSPIDREQKKDYDFEIPID